MGYKLDHYLLQGNCGISLTIMVIILSVLIVLIVALSGIGVCERCHMESGGVYFLISHVLGARIGGSVGVIYCFAQVSSSVNFVCCFAQVCSIADFIYCFAQFGLVLFFCCWTWLTLCVFSLSFMEETAYIYMYIYILVDF